MISHTHKCIFVEVPKTGSTSIRSIIGSPARPHQNICQIRHELESSWTRRRGPHDRLIACFYSLLSAPKRRQLGERVFAEYFKFGFVRNPWDRVVSLYLRNEGLQLRDKMTFEDFVTWIRYSSSTCVQATPHTNQLDWFVDPHGDQLVDFIGKFENLREDWKQIAERLQLKQELPHENRNAARTRPYTEYYSETTKAVIGRTFAVDIERFHYEFGA